MSEYKTKPEITNKALNTAIEALVIDRAELDEHIEGAYMAAELMEQKSFKIVIPFENSNSGEEAVFTIKTSDIRWKKMMTVGRWNDPKEVEPEFNRLYLAHSHQKSYELAWYQHPGLFKSDHDGKEIADVIGFYPYPAFTEAEC